MGAILRYWQNIDDLEVNNEIEKLVDFGFGYGTFTIPASRKINGNVYTYDIEDSLTKELESKLKLNDIQNVVLFNKDFIAEGTGLQNEEVEVKPWIWIMKKQDKNTRYFIDLNIETMEIINWDFDQRDLLVEEKLEIPGLHRLFISKGQYNKLVEKRKKFVANQ